MGSKNRDTTTRSRIIDNFLAKFKKAVNSAALPDKVVDTPMASCVNAAAVVVPPSALRSNAINTSYLNKQNRYSTESRRSSDSANMTRSEAISINGARPEAEATPDSSVASQPSCSSAEPSVTSCSSESNQSVYEKREANDFIFGKIIGEGSFSTVYLAKDIHNKREFAIKVCMKNHIIRERKVEQIKRERDILALMSSQCKETAPFFVKIHSSFQDMQRLYFVLSYAKHGELFSHINKVGSFDAACTQFYAGEILHALEHMHSLGVVHRDLKPENILLDHNMHIQITDFGSAKIMVRQEVEEDDESTARRNSFVGTAQYISPELLSDRGDCSRASDLWAFGAIIYQMVAGLPPFRSSSEYLIFRKIKSLEFDFPEKFNPKAKSLVERLLVLDPRQRIGSADGDVYTSIREHTFFEGVVLEELHKQTPPPIYPYLPGSVDEEEDLRSHYRVPDNLEPGLDDRQITRLLGLELQGSSPPREEVEPCTEHLSISAYGKGRPLLRLGSLRAVEIERRLNEQRINDPRWHNLCEGNLILKKGLVHKRKGLFARRRMLLLTTGPHLYYADPDTMTLKGEIPFSPELREESKSFKTFFVHTPSRTYYLQDPDGFALEWCRAIEELRKHTYDKKS